MAKRAFGVSSLWFNIERLLSNDLPGDWASLLLGVCGGAGCYPAGPLPEFALPASVADRLAARSAVFLRARDDDAEHAGLRQWLAEGRAAIVAVDSFYLPYRPAYGRVHSGRTVIVRGCDRPGEVLVDDCWPPVWEGRLSTEQLSRARRSLVPLEPRLEPVFAGVPLASRWWTVTGPAAPPPAPAAWLSDSLAALHRDERERVSSTTLIETLARSAIDDPATARRASLIVRAELGPRVHTLDVLHAAGHVLGDALIAHHARPYADALERLAHARDLLIKQCVRPCPFVERRIREELSAAAEVLADLVPLLSLYDTAAPARRHHA